MSKFALSVVDLVSHTCRRWSKVTLAIAAVLSVFLGCEATGAAAAGAPITIALITSQSGPAAARVPGP
jgi:hypothetical protein